MPSINKKYLKVGAAGLAVTALVVGLSVGLTRDKGTERASAASANAYDAGVTAGDFDRDSLKICSASTSSGKSGKSGGGKSGGKSGRRLVVPGTEDFAAVMTGDGKRRKLRNELARELKSKASSDTYYPTYSPTTYSYGSGKSGKSGDGGKSGKSGYDDGVTSTDSSDMCIRPDAICSYSFTSGDSSSGKSGKSGGGKSGGGKSGGGKSGAYSYDYSGKSGKSGGGKSGGGKSGAGGCGKTGKSGGGKSGGGKSGGGKSGGGKSGAYSYSYSGKSGKSGDYSYSYSGKSGKSGDYSYDSYDDGNDDDYCPSIAPSVCGTDCVCEEGDFYYMPGDDTCVRSCALTEACMVGGGAAPSYCANAYDDEVSCCSDAASNVAGCGQKADDCGECVCEAQRFYFVEDEGACFKSCELSRGCDAVPAPAYCSLGFVDIESCCRSRFDGGAGAACAVASRDCGVPPEYVPAPTYVPTDFPTTYAPTDLPTDSPTDIPTPPPTDPPTPPPTDPPTPPPTLPPTPPPSPAPVVNVVTFPPVEAFPPTPSPTMGSTPTVSAEATGPPTKSDREVV